MTKNSCESCPSYLPADEAVTVFKKNIGSAMCARFGHVLAKPGLKPIQQKMIAEEFAGSCPNFGDVRPIDAPTTPALQVTLGDPKIMVKGETTPAQQAGVTSCAECVNFVRPETVKDDFGWPTGLCAASGRLIMPQRMAVEAKNCEYRAPGPNRASTKGIPLMPQYQRAFEYDPDPIKAFLARRASGKASFVEPSEYPTDLPVEPDDAAAGIRAWRRIDDPEGSGFFTHLPIYRTDHLDESERDKVPQTGDDEHPELYVDHGELIYTCASAWRVLDETPMLWGIAGTGKTELARHLAWLMQLPFDRVSITAQTDVDDLIGKMRAGGGNTFFQYGRLPRRWTKPGLILLDEPNTGPDEVWQAIRPLTDNSKQLVIDQNEGERLHRNPDNYLMMAANDAFDARNIGANPLADADGSRLMHLRLELPPEPIERAILEDRCKIDGYDPSKVIDTIMKIAKEIRALTSHENMVLPITWGIRPQIKVIRATQCFSLMKAYKVAVANHLEPEQARSVLDIVEANIGQT